MRGRVKIDKATIEQLERLSLVNFGNEEGIRTLEDAIAFAEPLKEVRTQSYHSEWRFCLKCLKCG